MNQKEVTYLVHPVKKNFLCKKKIINYFSTFIDTHLFGCKRTQG